jgi:hypothetical protein
MKELTKVPVSVSAVPSYTVKKYTFTRGEKFFELSNHLGNPARAGQAVLAVIADKKLPVAKVVETTKVSHWLADVVNATGYYPVPVSTTVERMPMPGDS